MSAASELIVSSHDLSVGVLYYRRTWKIADDTGYLFCPFAII